MVKHKRKHKLTKFVALFFAFVFLFALAPLLSVQVAYANSEIYTNVLDDLRRNETFVEEQYPLDEDDYSLHVIQVAEGARNELYVYVYQPCGGMKDFYATSINISTAINDSLYYRNYKLEFLNSSGVFYKYKVLGLQLKTDVLRYYDISSIFRLWDESMDPRLPDSFDETIDEVPFEVAQLWTACTLNGKVYYNCTTTDVIEIVDKHVGYIRYAGGFLLYNRSCDSHYVAFSTNRQIDSLIEADVHFVTQTFNSSGGGGGMLTSVEDEVLPIDVEYSYGPEVEESVTLTYTDVGYGESGLFHQKKYSWNRIQSVSAFLSENGSNLSTSTKNELKNKQWVLRFKETDYNSHLSGGLPSVQVYESGTRVSEVTILRLKFETNGEIYNLGVIDNKQTGSIIPDNLVYKEARKWSLIVFVLILIVLFALFLPVIAPVLEWIVKALVKVITAIFKALWWLVTLPVKIFKKDD